MEIISQHITEIIAVLTTVLSFFVGKRMKKANVESTEIDNLKSIIEIQNHTIERMETRILHLESKVYNNMEIIHQKTREN